MANSLGPDQARQKVGPDLDPNFLTLMVFLNEFFVKKLVLEKKSFWKKINRQQKKTFKISVYYRVGKGN